MAGREYPDHPQVGVGAVVIREGCVLLVQRGGAPATEFWAIPGGRLRLGETLQEGAQREILEETGIVIRAGEPIFTCDSLVRDGEGRIRFHYVIVDMAASVEVIGMHPEKNRIRLKTFCKNQEGIVVLDGEALVSPPKAPTRSV